MFAYIIESYKTMNKQLFLTTFGFFILGLIYFCYKMYYTTRRIAEGDFNIGNEHYQQQQQREQHRNNGDENERIDDRNNETITIYIQLANERKEFMVKLSDSIEQFINTFIKPLVNYREVNLMYQGRQLNPARAFGFYSSINNMSVILCITRQDNHHNDNQNQFQDEEYSSNDTNINNNTISIYSLITHGMISLLMTYLIFCYKNHKELYTKSSLLIVQILAIFWALNLSKTLSTLFYYRKISY